MIINFNVYFTNIYKPASHVCDTTHPTTAFNHERSP